MDGPKPDELELAQNIQKWGNPWGHFRAMPAMLHHRLNHALAVHSICQSWEQVKPENEGAWIKAHPNAWELVIQPLIERNFPS